ncbi:Uncharacterised protein [Burkholderia pseudomallei]|nr:Uncharacterised protein [Burkholderia pseudomallei]
MNACTAAYCLRQSITTRGRASSMILLSRAKWWLLRGAYAGTAMKPPYRQPKNALT